MPRLVRLIVVLLVVPAVAHGSAEGKLARDIALELERQASRRSLWPGFDPLAIPLAIYTGEHTYLFRHPSPPSGFVALEDSKPKAYAFAGRHAAVTSNSSADLGGVATATLLADGERAEQSPSSLAATAIHEAFHVFQRKRHAGWSANEGDLFLYPVEDARLLERRRLESAALARALAADDEDGAACWARAALSYREERFAAMDSAFAAYERLNELNEGLATYVQHVAAKTEPEFPEGEFPAEGIRDRVYVSGSAWAFLLDRLHPGWKHQLETHDAQPLDRMLATALAGREETRCRISPDEVAEIQERASDDAAAVVEERGARRWQFDGGEGWRVRIEAADGQPLWPQGFDPLNVERIQGGVLHTRMLKLGNDAGELSMLDEEDVDLEAMTVGAGEHPLFHGVRTVTVAGLAEPEVENIAGVVSIRAPGLTAKLRDASVETVGQEIRVRIGGK